MPPEVRDIFEEWSPPLFLSSVLVLSAIVYTRGYFLIRKTRPALFPAWRMASFLLGLALIWLAIGSPMDGLADAMLSAHMVEHLLLMSFVPPLLLLGNPQVPILRGLQGRVPRLFLKPMLGSGSLRSIGNFLTKPLVAWLAMNLTFLAWHIPAAYDFALEHERWHVIEHLCFITTSVLFWWPLIRPWPTSAHYPGWCMLPYLVGADIINTALSAFLAFCDRPVYPYYLRQPNPFGLSPLADQVAGAAIMWVAGSLAFLIPAVYITVRLLQQDNGRLSRPRSQLSQSDAPPVSLR